MSVREEIPDVVLCNCTSTSVVLKLNNVSIL